MRGRDEGRYLTVSLLFFFVSEEGFENTTKDNFYTPVPTTGRRLSQSWEDKESADTSPESVDTSNLKAKDRQNAIQFHKYMLEAGHKFLSCYDQLLWYKPEEGIYTAFGKKDLAHLLLDALQHRVQRKATALGTEVRP